MRSLVAALLILATPFSVLAGGRWREGHGAPPGVYGPGRPMQPPPGGGPREGPRDGPMYPHGPAYYDGPAMRRGPYGPPPGVYAAPPYRSQQERAREAVRAGRRVPLPYVIERLRHQMGAEYMGVREVNDPSGRPMYVVRFRQHGRIIDVPVDAETGAVQR